MLLWFGLHVRQLQIAGVFAGTLMAWLLALPLCIAATLFRRLAGKEFLARQTTADCEYNGDKRSQDRFVGYKIHGYLYSSAAVIGRE